MVVARQPRRHDRAPRDPRRPRRLARGPRVDRQRLHARVRRPAAHRRRARRPLRAPAHVPRSASALFTPPRPPAALAPIDRRADRRPRRPGPRRRDRHAAHAHPARRRPSRPRGAALALGIWSGIGGLARRARPARRRRGRRGHLLAVDLLAQRARSASCSLPLARRVLRESHGPRARSTCPASGSSAPACSASSGAWSAGNARAGRRPQIVGVARRRRGPARRLRRLGAARTGSRCSRCASSATRAFAVANVASLVHVLRHVRLDLPAHPVLPDRAGLLAARGRAADAAVDADADVRRADRRRALRPHRRRAAHGAGLALQADRARRGSPSCPSPTVAYVDARAVPSSLAGIGMALFFAPVANVVLGVGRRRARPGQASGANNAIREVGGVLRRRRAGDVFAAPGRLRPAAGVRRRPAPALWVGAAVVAVGALVATLVPRRGRGQAPAAAEALAAASARTVDEPLEGIAQADALLGQPFPLPAVALPLCRWVDVAGAGERGAEVSWNLDDTRPGHARARRVVRGQRAARRTRSRVRHRRRRPRRHRRPLGAARRGAGVAASRDRADLGGTRAASAPHGPGPWSLRALLAMAASV